MSQQMPPRRRRRRHWVRNTFLGIIGLAALVVVIVLARSGGVAANTPTLATDTPTAPATPATHVAAPAKLGSYFDVQDSGGDAYGVALTKIIDPATTTDRITPGKGNRFVGAVFTIKAISSGGPQQENAEDAAVLVGSNGQTYLPDVIPIVGYTDFALGYIHAAQGAPTTGAVAFQVPAGVKVSKVQWSDFSSFGVRSTVQWNVPSYH
jgi:hypothetical protein